jgi:hypothetical protein
VKRAQAKLAALKKKADQKKATPKSMAKAQLGKTNAETKPSSRKKRKRSESD